MRRLLQSLLLKLTGLGLLRITLFSDTYLRYVKPGLRPVLIASGVVLLLLGVVAAFSRTGNGGHAHDDHDDHGGHGGDDGHEAHEAHEAHAHEGHGGHDGHDHSGTPKIAWLLVLPALSLLLFAPPALGAYTAARSGVQPVAVQKKGFEPLPATSPLPLTLTDFTKRVQQDRSRAIQGRTVRLTGFVTPDATGDGWYLTRIIFSCCAADSQTVKIHVYGSGSAEPPAANSWLAVTGTWHRAGTLGTTSAPAALDARLTTPIAQPINAFTDDLPITPG
ncbi:TIGR03943 family protein [Streptomyces sp. CMSTAAHL-2]|uniref:TIGR03943 family putative permease subunit n=1 Tax=Streptomyces sp. CMSTAAHL-2 TaxID=2904522 RepID=UPI001E30E032|nr:TIGR03943 family protein [Streptomyces sp. CMSTAAHL-2]MCE3035937.1 TIGR03943 family protein [Streptomyces sp. CMSTAAHL-2]